MKKVCEVGHKIDQFLLHGVSTAFTFAHAMKSTWKIQVPVSASSLCHRQPTGLLADSQPRPDR